MDNDNSFKTKSLMGSPNKMTTEECSEIKHSETILPMDKIEDSDIICIDYNSTTNETPNFKDMVDASANYITICNGTCLQEVSMLEENNIEYVNSEHEWEIISINGSSGDNYLTEIDNCSQERSPKRIALEESINSCNNTDFHPSIENKMTNKTGEQIILISKNSNQVNTNNSYLFIQDEDFADEELINQYSENSDKSSVSSRQESIVNSPSSARSSTRSKPCGHSNKDQLSLTELLKRECNKKKRKSINKDKNLKSALSKKSMVRFLIAEQFKTTHPNLCLSNSVYQRIEIFLRDIIYRIGDEAGNLMLLSGKNKFTAQALKYAIKLSLEKLKNEADVAVGRRTTWMI